MMKDKSIPVFVINGFLESGKTQFIQDAILRDPEMKKERVVIICCEAGETEYESVPDNVTVVTIDEKEDFTSQALLQITSQYRPTYIIIEYNGVWGMQTLYDTAVPEAWRMAAQLTIINAETFELYFSNMKSLFADMLRLSARVFVNRCTRKDNFRLFRDSIKPSAPRAEIIYLNDEEGVLDILLEEDLPYDLTQDVIALNKDTYLIWYIDTMDNPERYEGKTVEFTAQVAKQPDFPEDSFIAGNMVMTCCEDDMQFLGLVCRYEKAAFLKDGSTVKLRGEVRHEFVPEYGSEEPVLYVSKTTTMQSPAKKKKK